MNLLNDLHLINASFNLPSCLPKEFAKCWQYIVDRISVGGPFCGQSFGEKEEWPFRSDLTIYSYAKILQLFETQFVIESLGNEEWVIPCANCKIKQTHV